MPLQTYVRRITVLCAVFCFLGSGVYAQQAAAPAELTNEQVVKKLKDANERYWDGKMTHLHQDADRRKELIDDQHPFVAVLSCADSRVPPEVIFDQGLGDIFVVRVAGNVASREAIASLRYIVEHGTKHVLVLGHESCGAVKTVLESLPPTKGKGVAAPAYMQSLVNLLLTPVRKAREESRFEDTLDNAVRENVVSVARGLAVSLEALRTKVTIIGGRYDLHSGKVQFWTGAWQPPPVQTAAAIH